MTCPGWLSSLPRRADGMPFPSLREYARFYPDPVSVEAAYVRSVKVLLATGQEAKARAVLTEGLDRLGAFMATLVS